MAKIHTAQKRKTAARKARQRRAWAAFEREFKAVPQHIYGFAYLRPASKQRVVEWFKETFEDWRRPIPRLGRYRP